MGVRIAQLQKRRLIRLLTFWFLMYLLKIIPFLVGQLLTNVNLKHFHIFLKPIHMSADSLHFQSWYNLRSVHSRSLTGLTEFSSKRINRAPIKDFSSVLHYFISCVFFSSHKCMLLISNFVILYLIRTLQYSFLKTSSEFDNVLYIKYCL